MNARTMKTLIPVAADLLKTTPDKLPARLYGMGYRQTCGRCHGSGAHSFNRQDGAMCYGCSWRGEVAADLTPALIERIREDVEEGALDRYLDTLRLDQQITAQGKGLFKRLNAAYGASEVYCRVREEGVISCALGSAYIDRVSGDDVSAATHLAADKWLSPEDRIELLRRAVTYADAMEAYLPVVADHLAKSIESGLLARRGAEHIAMLADIEARIAFWQEPALRRAKIAEAQADLADLAPKPVLDLSDILAKRQARMGK
jgi:hypothetical protein